MSYLIKQNQQDSHQTVSAAILVVWSFINRDVTKLSFTKDYSPALKVKPIVVVSDILSAKTSSSKDNFMSTAEIVLSSGDLNYSSEFAPGDHAMLWMVNNVTDFKTVSHAVLAGVQANQFNSGLKFVGRVNSVRETLIVTPDGKKQLRYAITMKAFSEFGSYVYYNPTLSDHVKSSDQANAQALIGKMTEEWDKIFLKEGGGFRNIGVNNISKIIDLLIKVFMGKGPGAEFQSSGGQITSPNAAMLVPAPVVKVLGRPTSRQEGASANKYSDMLQTICGLQQYSKASSSNPEYVQFIPSNFNKHSLGNGLQVILNDPVFGTYISPPQNFNNVPIWSLLSANSNPTLNEMYCTLRTSTAGGSILPTLILRQIPFSNNPNALRTVNFHIKYTPYLALPRWKIDPKYTVMGYNLGTSDAARFNFFQCKGQYLEVQNDGVNTQAQQYLNDNLYMDILDIARNGLRTHFAVSTADVSGNDEVTTDIANWTALVADFYLNSQYKQNGTLTVSGIQEPIAIGDNLEFDSKVFHIESVEHNFTVSPQGMKSFTTSLSLSHGIFKTNDFTTEDAKIRHVKLGAHLPAYSDEEVYADERLIASSTQGRSIGINPSPPPDNQPLTIQQQLDETTAELEAKTDRIKTNIGNL